MTDRYFANQRVRHSVTRQYYEVGQEIPVDHVPPPALDALVARGVLRKVAAPVDVEKPMPPEVKPETIIEEAAPEPEEQPEPVRPTRSYRKVEEDNNV